MQRSIISEASENGKNTNKASDERTNEDRNPATNKGAKQHVQDEPTIKLPEAISQNERDWIETTQPSSPLQDVVAPKNKDNTDAQQTARLRRPVAATKPALEYTVDSAVADMADMENQLLAYHIKVATAAAEREEFAQHCTSLQQTVVVAQAETDSHRKKLLAVQMDLHQAKVWDFPYDCSVAEGKVETLTKVKVDAVGKLDAAKLTIGRWQASAESAKEKQHKLEVEVASLRNKRAADAKKLAQTVDQLTHHAATSMEKAVAQWTVDHATKVMSMQDQIDKAKRTAEDTTALLHRRNKALEAKLKQANDRVAILESQLRPLSHLTKRAKALEAVHSDNKRLQLELMAVHRQVAGKKAKSKPSHDYMDEQPSIVLSNNQFQHQHSPQTSKGVDTLQCELTRYAQVLLMSNRADEAGPFFEASLAQCPHHLDDAFVLRDHDECVNTLAHYAFFVEHHRHNWAQAKRVYERILANHPTHPHALGNYAMLVHKMNSATKAHETNNAVVHHAYNVAIREFPAHGSVLCKYAGLLVHENNVALAETYYTQAASTSPTSPDMYNVSPLEAERMYQTAHSLAPSNTNATYNLAKVLLLHMESPSYDINRSATDTSQVEVV
ncbi:hypothetical protein DYB38_005692 [Aphanomyces astaci]|uniref:Uncharacterized protein n=1 Tax=Aphanomyces astaci TaxID=112090 RepID=A0A397CGB2_APHAT|nr:hypothetical protein DYB38_005692 [Aphanomyces astaci]